MDKVKFLEYIDLVINQTIKTMELQTSAIQVEKYNMALYNYRELKRMVEQGLFDEVMK